MAVEVGTWILLLLVYVPNHTLSKLPNGCSTNGFGETCKENCEEGIEGKTCTKICQVPNCTQCNENGNCLTCKPGFYGQTCEFECTVCETCVEDGKNSKNYKCLSCPTGKYLFADRNICFDCNEHCYSCENAYSCTSCSDGYYGDACRNKCPSTCLSCKSETKCGECSPGWAGTRCQCNERNCIGDKELNSWCTDHGVCLAGCKNGYFGKECKLDCPDTCRKCEQNSGKCTQCIAGLYGLTCDQNCSDNCAHNDTTNISICAFDDGSCYSCKNGWFGAKCEFPCSKHCLSEGGIHSCARNGTCEKGDCIGKTCTTRCTASDCLKCGLDGFCLKCKSGKYGQHCELSCPQCENCILNKTSPNRSPICISCPEGKYVSHDEQDCKNCHVKCRTCSNDYNCTSCKDGYFGPTCDRQCPPTCKTCLSEMHCTTCKEGWTGPACRCMGMNCSHDGNSSKVCTSDGRCLEGCGNTSSYETCVFKCYDECIVCDQTSGRCLKCASGLYGHNCTFRCSSNCEEVDINGTALCDRQEGSCATCRPGWYGPKCRTACNLNCRRDDGIYGCMSNGSCEMCTGNTFGDRCERNCSVQCLSIENANSCKKKSGSCFVCFAGFYGEFCNISCSDDCMADCERTTGQCDKIKDPSAVATIVGVSVTISVIMLVIVLIILMIMRKRRYQQFQIQISARRHSAGSVDMTIRLPHENLNGSRQSLMIPHESIYDTIKDCANIYCMTEEINKDENKVKTLKVLGYDVLSRVPVSTFVSYVHGKQEVDPAWFRNEFKRLPKGLSKSSVVGYHSLHEPIIASGDGRNIADYTGAAYVMGYRKNNAFISAKGPSDEQVNDFWTMIWNANCMKIVMLTNLCEDGRIQCSKYWPDETLQVQYGHLDVLLAREELYPDYSYIIRTLQVFHRLSGEVKDTKQFHFLAWPNGDVPETVDSLLNFRNKVNEADAIESGPILVHGSSKMDRTGTYIVLDYLLQQATAESHLDVFTTVAQFMHQQPTFLQEDTQYEFIHEALVKWLTADQTAVSGVNGSHYFCGLLKDDGDYSEVMEPEKQAERQYESINDVFATSSKTSAARSAKVPVGHYYSTLLKDDPKNANQIEHGRHESLPERDSSLYAKVNKNRQRPTTSNSGERNEGTDVKGPKNTLYLTPCTGGMTNKGANA